MRLNKLNGWQRLWLVSCPIIVLIAFSMTEYFRRRFIHDDLPFTLAMNTYDYYLLFASVAFCILTYVAGLVIAWIRRGFQKES